MGKQSRPIYTSVSSNEHVRKHIILRSLLRCFELLEYSQLDRDDRDDKPHNFKDEYLDIEEMQNKLEKEYSHIIGGNHNGLVVIPSRFQYSKDVSIPIEDLKSKINEEKARTNSDKEFVKKMEGLLHDFEGNVTEHKVYSALTRIWKDKRGLLLHSFKPEMFLSTLTQRAKKQRENNCDLEFSKLEQKIAKILGIDVKEEVDEIMEK